MLWSYHYKPWQTVISFSVIVLWSPHIWQVVIWCFSPTSSIYVIPRMDLIHQDVMYVQVFPVAHLTCVPDKLISITDRALSWKAAGFACIHIQMHTCIHACTRIYDTHVHTHALAHSPYAHMHSLYIQILYNSTELCKEFNVFAYFECIIKQYWRWIITSADLVQEYTFL